MAKLLNVKLLTNFSLPRRPGAESGVHRWHMGKRLIPTVPRGALAGGVLR